MPPALYTCDICNTDFRSGDQLHRHLKTLQCAKSSLLDRLKPYPDKNTGFCPFELEYSCGLCGEKFNDGAKLELHISSKSCTVTDEVAVNNPEDHATFMCGICRSSFKLDTELSDHIQNEHSSLVLECFEEPPVEYTCGKCNAVFQSTSSLEDHVKAAVCVTSSVYTCGICTQTFSTAQELIVHVQNACGAVPNTPVYACGVCRQTFPTSDVLIKHMQIVCGAPAIRISNEAEIKSAEEQNGAIENNSSFTQSDIDTISQGRGRKKKTAGVTSEQKKVINRKKDEQENLEAQTVNKTRRGGRRKKTDISKPEVTNDVVGKKQENSKEQNKNNQDENKLGGSKNYEKTNGRPKEREEISSAIPTNVFQSADLVNLHTIPNFEQSHQHAHQQAIPKKTGPPNVNILDLHNSIKYRRSNLGQDYSNNFAGLNFPLQNETPVQMGRSTYASTVRPNIRLVNPRHGRSFPGHENNTLFNHPSINQGIRVNYPVQFIHPLQFRNDVRQQLHHRARLVQPGVRSNIQDSINSMKNRMLAALIRHESSSCATQPAIYRPESSTHLGQPPYQPELSTHLGQPPYQPESSTHLGQPPYRLESSTHLGQPPYRLESSTHLGQPPYRPESSTYLGQPPYQPESSTHIGPSQPVSSGIRPIQLHDASSFKLNARCPICKNPGKPFDGKYFCYGCNIVFTCAVCLQTNFASNMELQAHLSSCRQIEMNKSNGILTGNTTSPTGTSTIPENVTHTLPTSRQGDDTQVSNQRQYVSSGSSSANANLPGLGPLFSSVKRDGAGTSSQVICRSSTENNSPPVSNSPSVRPVLPDGYQNEAKSHAVAVTTVTLSKDADPMSTKSLLKENEDENENSNGVPPLALLKKYQVFSTCGNCHKIMVANRQTLDCIYCAVKSRIHCSRLCCGHCFSFGFKSVCQLNLHLATCFPNIKSKMLENPNHESLQENVNGKSSETKIDDSNFLPKDRNQIGTHANDCNIQAVRSPRKKNGKSNDPKYTVYAEHDVQISAENVNKIDKPKYIVTQGNSTQSSKESENIPVDSIKKENENKDSSNSVKKSDNPNDIVTQDDNSQSSIDCEHPMPVDSIKKENDKEDSSNSFGKVTDNPTNNVNTFSTTNENTNKEPCHPTNFKQTQQHVINDAEKMKMCVGKLRDFVMQHAEQVKRLKPCSDFSTASKTSQINTSVRSTNPELSVESTLKDSRAESSNLFKNNTTKEPNIDKRSENMNATGKNGSQTLCEVGKSVDLCKGDAAKVSPLEMAVNNTSHDNPIVHPYEVPTLFDYLARKSRRVNCESKSLEKSVVISDESDSESDTSDHFGYEEIDLDDTLKDPGEADADKNRTDFNDDCEGSNDLKNLHDTVKNDDESQSIGNRLEISDTNAACRNKKNTELERSRKISIARKAYWERKKRMQEQRKKNFAKKWKPQTKETLENDHKGVKLDRLKVKTMKLGKRSDSMKELRVELRDIGSLRQGNETEVLQGSQPKSKTATVLSEFVIETDSDSEIDEHFNHDVHKQNKSVKTNTPKKFTVDAVISKPNNSNLPTKEHKHEKKKLKKVPSEKPKLSIQSMNQTNLRRTEQSAKRTQFPKKITVDNVMSKTNNSNMPNKEHEKNNLKKVPTEKNELLIQKMNRTNLRKTEQSAKRTQVKKNLSEKKEHITKSTKSKLISSGIIQTQSPLSTNDLERKGGRKRKSDTPGLDRNRNDKMSKTEHLLAEQADTRKKAPASQSGPAADSVAYECGICSQKFLSLEVLTNHMQSHATKPNISNAITSNANRYSVKKPDFSCYKCSVTFEMETELIQHLKSHEKSGEGEQFVCGVCQLCLKSAQALMEHIRVHAPKDEFVCGQCNDVFSSTQHLEKHMVQHETVVEEFLCGICQTNFISTTDLEVHIQSHFNKTDIVYSQKCSNCDKLFASKSEFDEHYVRCKGALSSDLESISYNCENCREAINNVLKLHIHKKTCKGKIDMKENETDTKTATRELMKKGNSDKSNGNGAVKDNKARKSPTGKVVVMSKLLKYKPNSVFTYSWKGN